MYAMLARLPPPYLSNYGIISRAQAGNDELSPRLLAVGAQHAAPAGMCNVPLRPDRVADRFGDM